MYDLPWIDGHLDIAYVALNGRDLTRPCPDPAAGCISLPDLQAGRVAIAFATLYTQPVERADECPCNYPAADAQAAHAAAGRQLELYRALERDGQLSILHEPPAQLSPADPPRIVLLMEGADPIRSPEDVAAWAEAGLRLVGLTWALGTRYAGGNARPGPLTGAGRELVAALDERGLIHDVSHLCDESFDGLLACARGPIVATHSNARAVIGGDNQRHLHDDQIRAIAARDGVIGLNLFSKFLVTGRRATIRDCVEHVLHICQIMGHTRGVALGSDADGGFAPPQMPDGLEHPRHYPRLLEALAAAGFDAEALRGFAYENWLRLLRRPTI